ncbi:hypothetical protein K3495_g6268 [Podosphaera aphanis]|nr:hypothetical protein K3495_g6268 [Podosphaera aphanis]
MAPRRFETCGKYDGIEDTCRWLRNLSFDLENAEVEETPKIFFQSIDLNFVKEPARWLDSTPQYRRLTEQIDVPTIKDVTEFKRAFVARFSQVHAMESNEDNVQEDINNLAQGQTESILEYYGRALHLLRRSHGRDATADGGESLKPIKRMVVNGVIKAFLRGIHDESLKRTILMRSDKLPISLADAYEVAERTMRRLEQMKEFERNEYERMEVDYLRQDYAARNKRPLKSVLAEMYQRPVNEPLGMNFGAPRPVSSYPKRNDYDPFGRRTSQEEPKPAGREEGALVVRNTEATTNNSTKNNRPSNGRGAYQGQMNKLTPPRHLSRHPVINGSESYNRNMGDLCYRCGDLGHRSPNCRSIPLEPMEQNYLKETLYQGLMSNFAGFGSGSGNLRYREIQNSNWRSRCEEQAVNNIKSSQEIPVRQNAGNEDIPNLTCEEFDGIPFNERPSRPAQCMSVIIGFDDNKIRSPTPASKLPCDEGLTLESYLNLSNQKKRPRPMNIGDVLNDEEHTAKISKNATRRKRRAEKQLREIVGHLGQGPVNYKKLAEEIKVEVS